MTEIIIGTDTGLIDLCNLQENEIIMDDIFRTLGNQCRFNGRCNRFYSVAQHSLLVSSLMAKHDYSLRLGGLCHDFAEAYIGDIITPIKRQITGIAEIETDILKRIAKFHSIGQVSSRLVKLFDKVALYNEAAELGFFEPWKWVDETISDFEIDYESRLILETAMDPVAAGNALKMKYNIMVK